MYTTPTCSLVTRELVTQFKRRSTHFRTVNLCDLATCKIMGNFAPCCSSTPGTAVCLRKRSNIIHPAQRSESSFRSLTPVKKVQRTLSRSSFRRMSSLRIFTRKTESTTSDISVLGDNGKASILVTIDHQILSKYTVHTLLGRGSFSSVLKITSKNSNMEFAMKVIEKKMGERIVTWETELAVLKRVRHPHILYLHEVILTRRQAYFILQLATGGDLASKIVSVGSLGEHTSRELVVMILSALVYMHHHGITHRDLKLENCLFLTEQPDSSLVVSDFGLAHITVDGKPSEAGTHPGIAPLLT